MSETGKFLSSGRFSSGGGLWTPVGGPPKTPQKPPKTPPFFGGGTFKNSVVFREKYAILGCFLGFRTPLAVFGRFSGCFLPPPGPQNRSEIDSKRDPQTRPVFIPFYPTIYTNSWREVHFFALFGISHKFRGLDAKILQRSHRSCVSEGRFQSFFRRPGQLLRFHLNSGTRIHEILTPSQAF